jgi:hypothetical protein
MSTLVTQNNLLILKSNLLSQCCCDEQAHYWEAVPCDWYELPHERCGPYPGCGDHRKFVDPNSVCEGDVYVCECQQLTIANWSNLTESDSAAANAQLLTNYGNTTGIFSADAFSLSTKYIPTSTIYNNTFDYSNYSSFGDLVDAINNYQPNGSNNVLSLVNFTIHPSSVPDSLGDVTMLLNAAPDAANLGSRAGNIAFTYDGVTTDYALFTPINSTFASAIQSKLTAAGIQVSVIEDEFNGVLSAPIFYLKFDDCGTEKSNITVKYRWIGLAGQPSAPPIITYGDYVTGWGQEGSNYVVIPSGGVGQTCPYEDPFYNSIGYAVYQDTLQCCPQRGAHLGANQNFLGKTEYGTNFQYLENTFVDGDGCYKLSPFYFLFGKEGRLDDNPTVSNARFYRANCNYPSGECSTYEEWENIPTNGQIELFVPQFSHEVPWGPFGSYYEGIEDAEHAANSDDYPSHPAYIQNVRGFHYSPSGNIRTKGTWTNTTGILLEFYFYSWAPFDIRDGGSLNRFNGAIKTDTLSNRFTILRQPCCTGTLLPSCSSSGDVSWILSYNPTGVSVQQFIDDVNAIRTRTSSGVAGDTLECQLFNFCPMAPSSDLSSIPATKMNNLSSQLFDAWLTYGSYEPNYLIDDPERDKYGFSGASIRPRPARWDDKTAISGDSSSKTYTYPDTIFAPASTSRILHPPQASRLNTQPYPDSFNGVVRHNCRPAWLTMAGQERTVITLAKGTTNYDPLAQSVNVAVSGTFVNIIVVSGATTLASTGWQTRQASGRYAQSDLTTDLNNISFTWFGVPASSYNPVIATSGLPYKVYISDVTHASSGRFVNEFNKEWWEAHDDGQFNVTRVPSTTGFATSSNFGYSEPLLPLSSTDITNASVDLKSWIRFRSTGVNYTTCNEGYPNTLLPYSATRITSETRLNCDGDNYIEGNWLVSYGCNSYVCKTEWFIQANRCGCTTLPGCSDEGLLSYVAHLTNRDKQTSCTEFNTPRFYICETNIHENCDIPFLVKVPAVFTCRQGQTNCVYGDCWTDPYEGVPCTVPICPYNDPENLEDRDPIQIGFTNSYHGCPASTELGEDFDCWMNAPYDDWCQYIDPTNTTRVRKQDIPRSWPPEAYVVQATDVQFCTHYVNLFDDGVGDSLDGINLTFNCGDPFSSSNPYDAIVGLIPWVPYDYLIPAGQTGAGNPCFLPGDNFLYAYIRPIVKNYNASGLCDSASCHPVSIDCNTRCCRCGEKCSTNPCPDSNPQRGCTVTTTAAQNYEDTGIESCEGRGDGSNQFCIDFAKQFTCPGSAKECPCFDSTRTTTTTTAYSKTETTTTRLGYRKIADVCVSVTYNPGCCKAQGTTTTIENWTSSCGGDCFWSGCGAAPDAFACNDSGRPCSTSNVVNLGCDFEAFADLGFTASDSFSSTGTDFSPCIPDFYDYNNSTVRTYSSSVGVCGDGTTTAEETFTSDVVFYNAGGCADLFTCDCNSWDLGSGILFTGPYRDWSKMATTTVDAEFCAGCSFDSVAGTTDYEAIIAYQAPFSCGNISSVTSTVAYPPSDQANDPDWRCNESDDVI